MAVFAAGDILIATTHSSQTGYEPAMKACPNPKRVVQVLCLLAAFLSTAMAASPVPKRVLLIYRSELYTRASLELQQGMLSRLRDTLGQGTEFFCEQLEAVRFPESEGQALAWVRTRYAARGIDVVVFFGSEFIDILPGVPTIYAGFTPFQPPEPTTNRADKFAVRFKLDFRKTISMARRLQPSAKRVLVVAGSEPEDQTLLADVRAGLQGLDLPVEYLSDTTLDDLSYRLAHLPPDTIVFMLSYTRDKKGDVYHTPEVVASLSRVSAAPLYSVGDISIGNGAIGGYVVSFDRLGAAIADIVLQTLGGNAPHQISVPAETIGIYLLDWRELKRWGFSEKDLPAGTVIEYRVPTAWEQYRWRIISVLALLLLQSVLIVGLLISRRRRKRAEASLREMTGRLLESQNDERRRIARDLHDGTGQHLSGMALTLGQILADFPPGHERLRKLLQDSYIASRQALDEVRTVSYVLHPPILDSLGLVPALRWYLDGLEKRTRLQVEFATPAELGHLAPEAERALFRIVQESITNVLRHSGGTAIRVQLSEAAKGVALEIEDNGQGMTAEQLAQVEGAATLGVGLAGMRERVRQLGGSFKIESGAGGTKVLVTVAAEEEPYAAHSARR